jgi:5'-deoxynucleotidase YfbR-like HD superfamily hydrolase
LLAISLARYAEDPLDINRVVRMLLVHDVGEIDAADVMFFAHVNWEERKAAERAAVMRISASCRRRTPQLCCNYGRNLKQAKARKDVFAHAVHRTMPVLLNLANQGQSWPENGQLRTRG